MAETEPDKIESTRSTDLVRQRRPNEIPPELLTIIISSLKPEVPEPIEGELQWSQFTRILLSCCLVSKAWYSVAKAILHEDDIRICEAVKTLVEKAILTFVWPTFPDKLESLNLLIETVQTCFQRVSPLKRLGLYCEFYSNGQPTTLAHQKAFAERGGVLVTHCPKLRTLNAMTALAFLPDTPLPSFPDLVSLSVDNQNLLALAPLLSHLPNLSDLNFSSLDADNGPRFDYTQHLDDSMAQSLARIPPPTFSLRILTICQSPLSRAQCNWLLGSSISSLERLCSYNEGAHLDTLSGVIGHSLPVLHINPEPGYFDSTDELAVSFLHKFHALRKLHIEGRPWQCDKILREIDLCDSVLEILVISYSPTALEKIGSWLRARTKLGLRRVEVERWPSTDEMWGDKKEDVRKSRIALKGACDARGVEMGWVVRGSVKEYAGLDDHEDTPDGSLTEPSRSDYPLADLSDVEGFEEE